MSMTDTVTTKLKVLLADDHAIVRQGLRFFLNMQPDIEVVGEAANGREAVEQAKRLHPDVVLMDLIMPVMNGIESTAELRALIPGVKVLVLTTFADKDHVLNAIKAGANGYLLKDAEPDRIAAAIREAHRGVPQLDPAVAGQLMSHIVAPAAAASTERLTSRELEVLRLIAQGLSNKEIAAACGIAEKTVKTHVSSLLGKLGLADRTQAALFAVKNGIA
jgi:DNA-binding NarL/FixJ family response regulator